LLEWLDGSSLYYWRWHPDLREAALQGFKPYIISSLPRSFRLAQRPKGPAYDKLLKKFVKFISRRYFTFPHPRTIKNLIDYFYVSKGTDDIRPFFNGTSCGLTAA